VETQDYSTFAVLSKENFDKIAGEVPEVKNEMRKFVFEKYIDDEVKLWAFESIV
jgi:hypothetical protein